MKRADPRFSLALIVVGLLFGGCEAVAGTAGIRVGAALVHDGGWEVTPAPSIALGETFGYHYMALENATDRPLTVVGLRPIWKGPADIVEVQEVLLADNRDGDEYVSWGRSVTYPPVTRTRRQCVTLQLHESVATEPFVIEPGDYPPSLYLQFLTQRVGKTVMNGVLVTYETDGSFFEQRIPFVLRLRVGRDGRQMRPDHLELACLGDSRRLDR